MLTSIGLLQSFTYPNWKVEFSGPGRHPALHVAGAESAVHSGDAEQEAVGGHWSDEGIRYDPRARRFDEASTVDRTMSDRKLP